MACNLTTTTNGVRFECSHDWREPEEPEPLDPPRCFDCVVELVDDGLICTDCAARLDAISAR